MSNVSLQDKIAKILETADFANIIKDSPNGLTIDIVAKAVDRTINIGLSQMLKYDPSEFFKALGDQIKKMVPGQQTAGLNSICIQTARIIRNERSANDYSEIVSIIETNYEKITGSGLGGNTSNLADDDLSDFLSAGINMQGTAKDGFGEYVPMVDPHFRKWGDYEFLENVIASGDFMPILISGLSGNGKSINIEQACAALGREYLRLQISPETDGTDMIGGMTLKSVNNYVVEVNETLYNEFKSANLKG